MSGAISDHTRVTVKVKKGELVFEAKAGKKSHCASSLFVDNHGLQPHSSTMKMTFTLPDGSARQFQSAYPQS
jgi:hypothetical protein